MNHLNISFLQDIERDKERKRVEDANKLQFF